MSAYINNLPVELLFEIFEKLLEPPDSPFVIAKSDTIPFVLLLVCRSWRLTALSIPSLWTFVRAPAYNGPESFSPETMYIYKFVRQWLSFSESSKSPLHIQYHQPGGHSFEIDHPLISAALLERCVPLYAQFILSAFAIHEFRWESLDILLDVNLALALVKWLQLPSPYYIRAPRLRSLKLALGKTCISVPLDTLFRWLIMLPSLETLEIVDEWAIIPNDTLFIFRRAKKFTYVRKYEARISFEFSVHLLSTCHVATDVSLTGFCKSRQRRSVPWMLSFPLTEARTAHMPCLTRLELCNITRPIDLLRFFILPNLQDLEISGGLLAYYPNGPE